MPGVIVCQENFLHQRHADLLLAQTMPLFQPLQFYAKEGKTGLPERQRTLCLRNDYAWMQRGYAHELRTTKKRRNKVGLELPNWKQVKTSVPYCPSSFIFSRSGLKRLWAAAAAGVWVRAARPVFGPAVAASALASARGPYRAGRCKRPATAAPPPPPRR